METMEMPTQMTSNVPANVGGYGDSDSSFNPSTFENVAMYTPWVAESLENSKEPHVSAQTTPGVEGVSDDLQERVVDKSMADKLFESAKEDGFEEALEKLSRGDFDEEPSQEEILEEMTDEKTDEKSDEETVIEGELTDEKKDLGEDEITVADKIQMLEAKVDTLQKENKALLERAKQAELTNSVNQQIMLELARALYELAKEEENEKKKVSMLEIIIKMLTMFMEEIMTDGPVDHSSKEEEPEVKKTIKSESKSKAINALLIKMAERNAEMDQQNSLSSSSQLQKAA